MDRGASWAIVHGGHNSVRHDLATKQQQNFILIYGGLLRWLSGKESACNAGDGGLDPCVGKTPLEKGMAAHSSILAWENPMDRGAWQAVVPGTEPGSPTLQADSLLSEPPGNHLIQTKPLYLGACLITSSN